MVLKKTNRMLAQLVYVKKKQVALQNFNQYYWQISFLSNFKAVESLKLRKLHRKEAIVYTQRGDKNGNSFGGYQITTTSDFSTG